MENNEKRCEQRHEAFGTAFRPNAKFWDLKPTDILDDMPFVFPRFRRSTAGVLLGANGVGKSMFALSLAMGLAGGVSFLGPQFEPSAPRRTVYVTSGENVADLQVRMSAIRHFSKGADRCDFECVSRNCAVYSLPPDALRDRPVRDYGKSGRGAEPAPYGAVPPSSARTVLRSTLDRLQRDWSVTGLDMLAQWLPVLLADTDLVVLDLKPDGFWDTAPQAEFCRSLLSLSDRVAAGSQSSILLVLQDSYRSAFDPGHIFPVGLDFCEFYNKSFGARLELAPEEASSDCPDVVRCTFKPAMYFETLRPCRYERRFFGVLYPVEYHIRKEEGDHGRAVE